MGKWVVIWFALLGGTSSVSAQFNYYRLSIGANSGLTRFHGDTDSATPLCYASTFAFNYRPTAHIRLSAEIQHGTLSAGDSIRDPHKRFFRNRYNAFSANAYMSFAQLGVSRSSRFSFLRSIWVGVGYGLLLNNMVKIKRTTLYQDGSMYTFPGVNRSTDVVLPITLGFEHHFPSGMGPSRVTINLNYQFNSTLGDGADGYMDNPAIFNNRSRDRYSLMSVGLSYGFGGISFGW